MKKFFIVLIIPILFSGCKKDKDTAPPTGPSTSCIFTGISLTATSNVGAANQSTTTSSTTIQHNDKGLVTGFSSQQSTKESGNKTSAYNYSYNYEYDARDFVTRGISSTSSTDGNGVSSTSTGSAVYEYSNDRLARETYKFTGTTGADSYTSTSIQSYEYDGSGNLTKRAYNSTSTTSAPYSASVLYEYTGNKLSKIIYVDAQGGQDVPIITIDSKNRLTREVHQDGTETRYAYDAEGNTTLYESWTNGKRSDWTITEYDNQKNIDLLQEPEIKGYPDTHTGNNRDTHNITKISRFYNNGGAELPYSTDVYTYQYNTAGWPTFEGETRTNSTGAVDYQANNTYSFSNCQ